MQSTDQRMVAGRRLRLLKSERAFYGFFLPLGVLANLGLGVLILSRLSPMDWVGWLQLATGAFCCLVAGWLGAAAWSQSYWSRTMTRQVALWRRIADTIFAWLEEAPLPAEDIRRLKTSLDEAVPAQDRR
jgi:hypothetical protein